MAKKAESSDRSDPTKNKSLAIRTIIERMPEANFAETAKAVQEEFGHEIRPNLFYALKAKSITKKGRRGRPRKSETMGDAAAPAKSSAAVAEITSPAQWVDAINAAKKLLNAAGSASNAIALIKAIAD